MALNQTVKSSPHLLDTLLQLNDIIKSLSGDEMKKAVQEIKKEKEELDKAHVLKSILKREHDKTVIDLENKISEHKEISESVKKQKEELEKHIAENTKLAQRAHAENSGIASNKASAEAHIAKLNADLDNKIKDLEERELRVKEDKKQCQLMKQEYEEKLQNLKKITG